MTTKRRDFVLGGCGVAALRQLHASTSPKKVELANKGLSVIARLGDRSNLQIPVLQNRATGFNWCRANNASANPSFTSANLTGGDWRVSGWKQAPQNEIHIDYETRSGVSASQYYRLAAELPVLECGGEFRNSSSQPATGVTDFGSFHIPLRSDLGPLQVHCVSRDTYAVQRLPFLDKLVIQGGGWNSPKYCGLLVLEAMEPKELLFCIVQWERGWQYQLIRSEGVLSLSITLSDLTHTLAPRESLTSPTVFVGVGSGDPDNAFRAAQRHLRALAPRTLANWPWVSYDIWGTESSGVEESLLAELNTARDLGVDLFYVDASWYRDSSKKGTGDWGCGLGNYEEDRQKFPHGLASLSDKVHAHGMKFGLWVGPNIVDSRLVGKTISTEWIAQLDGKDRVLNVKDWESSCHQVCLGCTEYVDFLKKTLTRLVREFHLDWLKWDNSGIPGIPGRCNRSDHGHQAGDGSYKALIGQYEVYRHLHREFPDLVLEQCGYGSRLDYGLVDTIRANWLSDASFPSNHVRQNALAGGYIYPAAYNGAWIVKDPEIEKTKDADILDSIFRSRMLGLFGFGTLTGTLPERVSQYPQPVLDAAKRNIPVYKRYRHLLQEGAYHLFPAAGSAEGWQAVQFAKPSGTESVILCFRGGSTQSSIRLPVKAVRPNGRYAISNAKGQDLGTASGTQLLSEGLIVTLSKKEMSDVMFLTERI